MVTEQGNLDRLGERFRGTHMTLLQTNLTDVERDELLEALGHGLIGAGRNVALVGRVGLEPTTQGL